MTWMLALPEPTPITIKCFKKDRYSREHLFLEVYLYNQYFSSVLDKQRLWLLLLSWLRFYQWSGIACLHIWAASREKVPNVLSRCHTKRRTRPPFFWYDTDFSTNKKKKKKKNQNFFFFKKILKSRWNTKRRGGTAPRARPSFGITTT